MAEGPAAATPPPQPPSPIRALFAGDVAGYLRDAAFDDAPLFFVHVPKTAGTSLRAELAALRPPDANVAVDHADAGRSFHEKMDAALLRYLAAHDRAPFGFASGHVLGRHVMIIRARIPRVRLVTFLRDPVARVVSDYHHQCSPRHPTHAEFRARVPTLADYAELRGEQDKMARHLLPQAMVQKADAARCVNAVLRLYDFIGLTEHYATCFRLLTSLAGAPAWPRLRENVGTAAPEDAVVPPALAARIRALNPLDCALHDHVAARYARILPRLREALGTPPA
jgi:hypothetical protein